MAPVTPTKPVLKPLSRFKDVDVSNLGVHSAVEPSYETSRNSNKFPNHSTPYKKNPYEQSSWHVNGTKCVKNRNGNKNHVFNCQHNIGS